MEILQTFKFCFLGRNGSLELGRKKENDSWLWDFIGFFDFNLGDVIIDGCASRQDEWCILLPFYIIKDDQKMALNLTNTNLEKLCESAINDISTFERELNKLINMDACIEKQNLISEFATVFTDGDIIIRIEEGYEKSRNGKIFQYKKMNFSAIPISDWTIFGKLIQKGKKQKWDIKDVFLSKDVVLPNCKIEEEVYLTEEEFKPLKKEFISLFKAMRNENYELVKQILVKLKGQTLPKKFKSKSIFIYRTDEPKMVAIAFNDCWRCYDEQSEKRGFDEKTTSKLRKLIKLTRRTGDDTKLKRFCNKILKCDN